MLARNMVQNYKSASRLQIRSLHLVLKLELVVVTGSFYLNVQNRQPALAGAHVVMAVRRPKVAQELIQKWQNENSETGRPLNAEVILKILAVWPLMMNEAV
jgi:hypothetical protein